MNDWELLKEKIADWGTSVFGGDSHVARFKKLIEEANEALEAFYAYHNTSIRKMGIADELADVFIVGFHIARVEGIDLFEAIQKKFEEVQKRDWTVDAEGIFHRKK